VTDISKKPKNADISAENALLSHILNHNMEGMIVAYDIFLQPSDFYYRTNSAIFRAMTDFYEENPNGKIDKYIIYKKVKEYGEKDCLTIMQKDNYIDTLFVPKIGKDSAKEFAVSVKKNAVFRNIASGLDEFRKEVEEFTKKSPSLEDLLCLVENKYNKITENIVNPNARFERMGDGYREWIQDLIDNPCDYSGIPTGFPNYDASIGRGLRRGSVNMLGARTGVGKSLLSINIGNNIASNGIPILYIDTELVKEQQNARFTASRANLNIFDIETGRFGKDPNKKKAVLEQIPLVEKLPMYHQYVGGWQFEEILAYMKKWVRQEVGQNEDGTTKDCVIIFDYLKMMRTDGLEAMKEFQIIGFWMTMLHDFSVRYDIPILMLIQLNRDGITNEGQGVAAQSDRTEWLASSFTLLKNKDEDEMCDNGQFGNAKLVVVKSRFGPTTPFGDWINIYAEKAKGKIYEGKMQSVCNKSNSDG